MIEHLTKVKNLLMIQKAYFRDKKNTIIRCKGHSAVSDAAAAMAMVTGMGMAMVTAIAAMTEYQWQQQWQW